MIFPRIPPL